MQTKKLISTALLALPLLFLAFGSALAVTPANTTIRNSATLTGVGLPPEGITASVDVKVDLVPQKPTLSRTTVLTQMPDDNNAAEGDSVTVGYRLTTNANGPDTFTIAEEDFTPVNLTGNSGAATYSTASISLGASAASATANVGATAITVPYDGSGSGAGGSVNGIAQNDLIRIGDNDYVVASVSEDPTTQTATITLTAPLQAAVALGDPIREYVLFDMTIANVGTVVTAGSPAYIDVSTRATSQTNAALFDADSATDSAGNGSDGHRTNVVSVSFNKYIRNVTNPNGSGTASTFNTFSFYPTAGGVTAAPGDVLEYALVIVTSDAGLADGVLTDTVPAFTTYQAGSTFLNGGTAIPDDAGIMPLVDGYDVDIPGAGTTVITFQVKVNN